MCVIALCNDKRATRTMVEDMWEQNSHGGGVAWREADTKGVAKVKWRKGLTLEEMIKLNEELPFPYVMHFRIASVGGVRNELCHPFLVSMTGKNDLEGETKGEVLFHNGDWRTWREVMLNAAIRKGVKVPEGKFSDTRAMAWLASIYGANFMELINEKGIIISPDEIQVFLGSSGWKTIDGVFCSNDHFFHSSKRYKMCIEAGCKMTHGINSNGYCWSCNSKREKANELPQVKRDGIKVGDVVLAGERGGLSGQRPFQALIAAAEKDMLAGRMGKKKFRKLKKRYEKEAEMHWRDVITGQHRTKPILH